MLQPTYSNAFSSKGKFYLKSCCGRYLGIWWGFLDASHRPFKLPDILTVDAPETQKKWRLIIQIHKERVTSKLQAPSLTNRHSKWQMRGMLQNYLHD